MRRYYLAPKKVFCADHSLQLRQTVSIVRKDLPVSSLCRVEITARPVNSKIPLVVRIDFHIERSSDRPVALEDGGSSAKLQATPARVTGNLIVGVVALVVVKMITKKPLLQINSCGFGQTLRCPINPNTSAILSEANSALAEVLERKPMRKMRPCADNEHGLL